MRAVVCSAYVFSGFVVCVCVYMCKACVLCYVCACVGVGVVHVRLVHSCVRACVHACVDRWVGEWVGSDMWCRWDLRTSSDEREHGQMFALVVCA